MSDEECINEAVSHSLEHLASQLLGKGIESDMIIVMCWHEDSFLSQLLSHKRNGDKVKEFLTYAITNLVEMVNSIDDEKSTAN